MARETETQRDHQAIGKRLPRPDALGKVIGKTVYANDLQLPGMLHARALRSPHTHARILRIDTSKAKALAGVEAVLTADDLPPIQNRNPSNRFHVPLAQNEVLFHGQAVAAVLASDPSIAEEALHLIDVQYEALPAVIDPLEAMKEGSPLARSPLHDVDRSETKAHAAVDVAQQESEGEATNIGAQMNFRRGDVEKALAEADIVVEGTWRPSSAHQGYIETQSTVADYSASGELTIWASTQGPFWVRHDAATALGIPENKVRVVVTEVGGGFGGKIFLNELLTASLAMVVRRPVKLVLSRKEDLISGNPAPQAIIELKTGMTKDGTLTALKGRVIYDTGAFPAAPMLPGLLVLGGHYRCDNLELHGVEVLTNKVSIGALRAPGVPQVTFALENHIDQMAHDLGLDPLEVRLKNCVLPGDPLPHGQAYPSIGLRECLERVADTEIWQQRKQAKERGANRGVGLAIGCWLSAIQPASATVMLNSDGTLNVAVGSTDLTGTNTSFGQIAAEVLNVSPSRISVTTGDTKVAPYSGVSGGSKTLFCTGQAVQRAAEDARQQMLSTVAQRLERQPDELEIVDGVVQIKGSPEGSISFERLGRMTTAFMSPYAPIIGRGTIAPRQQAPGFTAQLAEVEVDPETGQVRVLRYVTIQDAGFAINPLSVEGQMQGGTGQGIGLALSEGMVYDEEGRLLNANLLDYRIPTSADVPRIETIIVEVPSDEGPYGARGVGEPPIVATSATISNAIYDAIGVRVREIPITPERILRTKGRIQD